MGQTFLTELNIVNTRHLHNIRIPLSVEKRKHLILTGKNGSGKSSILQCINDFLSDMVQADFGENDSHRQIAERKDQLKELDEITNPSTNVQEMRLRLHREIRDIEMNTHWRWNDGCVVTANDPHELRRKCRTGEFILAFCRDDRQLNVDTCTNPTEVEMKQVYRSDEHPAVNIGKLMANMKFVQAFLKDKKTEEAKKRNKYINDWFKRFRKILRDIYDEPNLELHFDEETFHFFIKLPGREPFPLEHMSMGYSVVFDIVGDIMMRMESRKTCDLEGIVLIDEVENHLHVSLQRQVMPILTTLFPNIQFILTTHSPFVLISTENAVVYDLERDIRIEDEMTWLSYEGVVDGYFETDRLSQKLRSKFNEYKKEVRRKGADRNEDRIQKLEDELNQIPDYLALDFKTEFHQLRVDKGRFEQKDDKSLENKGKSVLAVKRITVRQPGRKGRT